MLADTKLIGSSGAGSYGSYWYVACELSNRKASEASEHCKKTTKWDISSRKWPWVSAM